MTEESTSNNDDLNNEIKPVPIVEKNVYADVLAKLQSLQGRSEKKEDQRNVLNDGAKYMAELIELMEENNDITMNARMAVSIENGFQIFVKELVQISMKELMENDVASVYEIFYLYTNLFNLSGMKTCLKRLPMQYFVKILYTEFASIIFAIIATTVGYCKFTAVDLEEPRNNQELLLIMLNYVKDELEPDSSLEYSTMAESILAFLWNYADKTVVVPNLIKVGYPEAIIKWLSVTDRPSDESSASDDRSQSVKKSKLEARRPLISIVHNISRHDDGINALNALNAIDVVKKVQSSTDDSEINILSCMILALLLTPEQIKNDRKHMNNALDQLLQTVSNASKSKDFKDDGFHISEQLVVLVKLFNDDRALDYILQHAQVELDASSTVEFFANLLLKFNDSVSSEKDPLKQLTCTALVNILWSVSFQEHHQYKRQLKNNQALMTFLEKLAESDEINDTTDNSAQYVPKYIENIQTAAKGILLNMSEKISTTNTGGNQSVLSPSKFLTTRRGSIVDALVPVPLEKQDSIGDDNNNNKPMIMISYSHDDKVLCYQLEEELKRNDKFEVWIDKEFCSTGDSWEHIARGIKQSQVVLCLITKNYTSKSVRREVIYAIDRLDKPLLPVFISKPDLPEWLDIRTCDLTYVRFTDEKQLERPKMPKLIETLQKLISGSTKGSGTAPTHYEAAAPSVQTFKEETKVDLNKLSLDICTITDLSEKPVQKWNKSDIKQWWQENGIILELYDLCQFSDGSELLSFAENLLVDEKTHYKTYAKGFEKLHDGKILLLHQFNKFSNALRKLVNEQDNGTLKEKPIQNTSTTKSQACQIL